MPTWAHLVPKKKKSCLRQVRGAERLVHLKEPGLGRLPGREMVQHGQRGPAPGGVVGQLGPVPGPLQPKRQHRKALHPEGSRVGLARREQRKRKTHRVVVGDVCEHPCRKATPGGQGVHHGNHSLRPVALLGKQPDPVLPVLAHLGPPRHLKALPKAPKGLDPVPHPRELDRRPRVELQEAGKTSGACLPSPAVPRDAPGPC